MGGWKTTFLLERPILGAMLNFRDVEAFTLLVRPGLINYILIPRALQSLGRRT